MKDSTVGFINIHTDSLILSNELSVIIDATKVVWGVRLSHHHKTIVGDSHPNHLIFV